MIYKFRIAENRVKYLDIESDSTENAEEEVREYVESGEFDMDKNMDSYECEAVLIGEE